MNTKKRKKFISDIDGKKKKDSLNVVRELNMTEKTHKASIGRKPSTKRKSYRRRKQSLEIAKRNVVTSTSPSKTNSAGPVSQIFVYFNHVRMILNNRVVV